jgi:hypothetical protein
MCRLPHERRAFAEQLFSSPAGDVPMKDIFYIDVGAAKTVPSGST